MWIQRKGNYSPLERLRVVAFREASTWKPVPQCSCSWGGELSEWNFLQVDYNGNEGGTKEQSSSEHLPWKQQNACNSVTEEASQWKIMSSQLSPHKWFLSRPEIEDWAAGVAQIWQQQ